MRDEAAWPGVIAEAEKNFGRLDIMVANAGIGVAAPIETMALADWQRQQAINLDGVFLSIKHAIPALRRAGGGSLVLMSSIAGLRGAPGLAAYSATKGGVRLLAKSGGGLEHAADTSAATRCIPASSPRRSGARSRPRDGQHAQRADRPASARPR